MGLIKVGPTGGVPNQVLPRELYDALGFTNLDIDPRTGVIYFTDSSSVYQRRNRGDDEWSKPGRLMTTIDHTSKQPSVRKRRRLEQKR
ncbi:Strictosidine synthase conserved region [Arabidopsis thaliana x Arabidopsis arenosa]|uniref:Strictosidine synthase conserved region n=1 Tax=Arabidopsis thaliana x Arabidopsis arenosa TaxID=1240361 RepID=A0A8T2AAA1_9BRAS|nr:Strictosidine synthase conserved region [Arabidopsis thaliana x Arabidopsis arenosa]